MYHLIALAFMFMMSFETVFAADTKTNPSSLTERQSAGISISQAIVYKPLLGSLATAGYGKLRNDTDKDMKLQIISAEGFKAVEMHETVAKKGFMKMQKLNSVNLKPGKDFDMSPGGHHIMLFEALKEFKEGDIVKIQFKVGSSAFVLPFAIKEREVGKPRTHH